MTISRFTSLCAVAALAWNTPAIAQTYPERPVKMVVPYAAGGITDGVARVVAAGLSDALGKQFIVENRGGASGAIAMEAVKNSAPDGYTLIVISTAQTAILPVMQAVKYKFFEDFVPVSNFGHSPQVLAINPKIPVKTAKELVEWVKAQPNPSYAGAGPGSGTNLSMVSFMQRTGLKIAPVHFRGGSELINNVMAGHVPMAFMNASDVVAHRTAGTVRVLAVTSKERLALLPDVPTMIEAGFPDFVMVIWNGVAAPAGTPKPIVDRIAAGIKEALSTPKNRKLFDMLAASVADSSPEAFAEEIKGDVKMWGDLIRTAGLDKLNKQGK